MKRVVLFLKGMCMGIADVIPGVSGGTLALILGVYKELVDTIKGLNLRFLRPLIRWVRNGRQDSDWLALLEEIRALNVEFLVNLGLGIAAALGVGSVVIPGLMENYPVEMRAFFFGLIVASVWVPFRMIEFEGSNTAVAVAVSAAVGLGVGWFATNPANTFESSRTWFEIESSGQTLKEIARSGPSALPSERVFWAPENQALRDAVRSSAPETFAELSALRRKAEGFRAAGKDELEARSAPYDTVEVPDGTPVHVPRPAHWFVFLAGAIAICAMILPGISGSYILLILNAYFFILNALKGFLTFLAHGMMPVNQGGYVLLFCAGAAIGLLSFARLLSYLLREYPAPTLGVLVGLMVGCLRGIWPFRATVEGAATNVMPAAFDATVMAAAATFVLGFAIVATFTWIGHVRDQAEAMEHPSR